MILDIVGLQISVPEFILTIISFFLFMFLLNKFLFKPVLSFMDARKARIDEGLAEGKKAEAALEENKAQLAQELAQTGADARGVINAARSDAEKAKGEVLNAAHAVELGSCWINRAREMFDTEEGKALLRQWGIPEHYRGIGCCILGYADENPASKERAANRIWKI